MCAKSRWLRTIKELSSSLFKFPTTFLIRASINRLLARESVIKVGSRTDCITVCKSHSFLCVITIISCNDYFMCDYHQRIIPSYSDLCNRDAKMQLIFQLRTSCCWWQKTTGESNEREELLKFCATWFAFVHIHIWYFATECQHYTKNKCARQNK